MILGDILSVNELLKQEYLCPTKIRFWMIFSVFRAFQAGMFLSF